MGQLTEKPANYIAEFLVIVGYIIFFCLASILYFFFISSYTKNVPKSSTPVNVFATNLPPTTPIPHISSVDQLSAIKLFEDDFTTDQNHWSRDMNAYNESVSGGKLILESLLDNNYAITGCGLCPKLKEPFYLQADFATTTSTDKNFGFVFNLNYSNKTFYMFQINTEAKKYFFYNRTTDNWSLLTAGESDQIKSFPTANALGVYVDQGVVEFYINGEFIDSYYQSGYSFYDGNFSFYVDNSGFKMVVDNLIINKAGK